MSLADQVAYRSQVGSGSENEGRVGNFFSLRMISLSRRKPFRAPSLFGRKGESEEVGWAADMCVGLYTFPSR